MNVEMFFVKTANRERVSEIVLDRLKTTSQNVDGQPDWGLPSSYDVLLVNEHNRKIAISTSRNGWVAAVESKEVLDFQLLQMISVDMDTEVVAIQLSDVTGAFGFALCNKGKLQESTFCETSDDPLADVRMRLMKQGISIDVHSFRNAIQRKRGWSIVQRR
ncbi:MAG: hypothetical protein V1809_02215 [Planctomycetota bacterium]